MRAEKLWNRLAKNWDKPGTGLGENDIRLIAKTQRYLKADSNILDYGCATGSICFELAKTAGTVYGVDISSKMIDIARAKAAERQTENISFIRGSIFNEGLKKESFDVITAFNILHLAEDTPQVLQRIHGLLKPGGVFISYTPCLGQKKLISQIVKVVLIILSKTGFLPEVNYFTTAGLAQTIKEHHFSIEETDMRFTGTTHEFYVAARKA